MIVCFDETGFSESDGNQVLILVVCFVFYIPHSQEQRFSFSFVFSKWYAHGFPNQQQQH